MLFYVIAISVIIVSALPFISHQHWFFRVWDFGRIQLLVLLALCFCLSFVWSKNNSFFLVMLQLLLLAFIVYNCWVLAPYTRFYKKEGKCFSHDELKDEVSIISVNVYQFNKRFDTLIQLVNTIAPDILLTMESNEDWEKGLVPLEKDFPYWHKIALENTYGMHFYSKLRIVKATTNYFVADDIPSFEIILETKEKQFFTFFGVHPPPPNPTEEENSKERDGELLAVAKKVKASNYPVIVSGDFNNVAWAKSSVLFKKKSGLIDPRIGRGFVSTFHAKYKLLRFPIDLFFHSEDVFIQEFKTLASIGSDHLPLFCKFVITYSSKKEKEDKLDNEEEDEIEEMITEGRNEESDRKAVAEE